MASGEELHKAKAKLAALNAINSALTKENEDLWNQLEDLRDQLEHASEPKSASGGQTAATAAVQYRAA
jgi:regulator of replication initiation timing